MKFCRSEPRNGRGFELAAKRDLLRIVYSVCKIDILGIVRSMHVKHVIYSSKGHKVGALVQYL